MKTEINTDKVKESANNIKKLSKDLETNFNELFDMLKNVPSKEIWIGKLSSSYAELANKDRIEYINFANEINKIGNTLFEYAEKIENKANSDRME